MRRFASIDLMRGSAIWMMVICHVIMRWYNYGWAQEGEFEGAPLFTLVFFVFMIYFSAWAGFFLMVSAVGNMISMYRSIERGNSWKRLVLFQVLGGSLLLVAAVLVESTIGYHGFLGELVMGHTDKWHMILWRGFHMETIHTIALCIIINGIVQGLLSRNGGHRKVRRNTAVYLFLIISVMALTGPIWKLLRTAIDGYPTAVWESPLAGELGVQYAVIGESSFSEIIIKAVMAPLGGLPEPIFPFLALSFAGSMIGMYLCQENCSRRLPRYGIMIGLSAAFIGLIGTAYILGAGISDPEVLFEYFYQIPGLYPYLWLFWFLFLTGGQLAALLLVLRLVEFRGIGAAVGRRTLAWRRYGYVAFTIYTFQHIDVLPRLLYDLIPDLSGSWPYPSRLPWLPALALIPMTLLLWEIVLRFWERIEYAGGMEWCIAKVAEKLLPGRRERKRELRWWQVSRLNAKEYLYRPKWIDIVERDRVDHVGREDSKLAFSLSLFSIIFFPLAPVAFMIGKRSSKVEGGNWLNRGAQVIGVSIMTAWAVFIVIALIIPAPSI